MASQPEVQVATWTQDWHPELKVIVATSNLQPVGQKHMEQPELATAI